MPHLLVDLGDTDVGAGCRVVDDHAEFGFVKYLFNAKLLETVDYNGTGAVLSETEIDIAYRDLTRPNFLAGMIR